MKEFIRRYKWSFVYFITTIILLTIGWILNFKEPYYVFIVGVSGATTITSIFFYTFKGGSHD